MKNKMIFCLAFLTILMHSHCQNVTQRLVTSTKIKGLSFVAPREPFKMRP